MILKWIRSVVDGQRNEVVQQGAIEETKKQKEAKLVDIAHEALTREAQEHSTDLKGLVKYGWPHVKREKFKSSTRKKVWDIVRKNFAEDDEMIEEVTERIVDTAEVDPYYQKIFENKSE